MKGFGYSAAPKLGTGSPAMGNCPGMNGGCIKLLLPTGNCGAGLATVLPAAEPMGGGTPGGGGGLQF